jgi:hypothetical protein
VWLAFHNGRNDGDLVHVLPELEAIAQFTAELHARLASVGVDGLAGTVALYRRLRATLDGIPPADLERVREHVVALECWLHDVARCLGELDRLKRATGF